ncbi:class I SAM-dependent methyltransferase [Flammeovirga pacifica]|uniref:SAM-dependent methyltransferase n=1 Tax=Flammeovirga pacifica TaxID=915059 RepID=A0A1S1Z5N0_FLAPC|nr:class I SAM-dependent methyltransferase [Flammeovirga pacifica]OHX68580.1 SAM-dependent methyltransferase [Flammeovirga pacifica]
MEVFDKKEHWENIYQNKAITEVSWYQKVPETSLDFIERSVLPKRSSIIDVGGGDSLLVDHLLKKGYTNLSVLDISSKALQRAQERLGDASEQIQWIESDASQLEIDQKFDLWHDRAAFHFLTEDKDIENYKRVVSQYIKTDGILIIGTFSENGPKKCSGIPIKQYSVKKLAKVFEDNFELINTLKVDHTTPFDTVQNFSFCCLRKK